jgi:hypothetical protein
MKNKDDEFSKWGRKIIEKNVKKRIKEMINVVCN